MKSSRSFRGPLVAAAAVIALAQGAAFGATASPSRVSQPVQATKGDDDPTRTYSGPFVAVDPDNPLRVVASYVELRNRRCGLMRSMDGGATWTRLDASPAPDSNPFCLATNNNIFHAHMAFGRNGTLYYALTGWDLQDGGLRSGNTSVLLGRSKDLGDTWETTIARNARGLQGNDMEQNRPISGIVVDTHTGKEDVVYVTYRRQLPNVVARNASPIRPMVVASTDRGRTFGEPMDLTVGVFDSDAVREEAFKTTTTLAGPTTTTTLGPAGTLAAKPNQAGNFGGGTSAITVDDKGTIYAVWASITFNMANNPAAAIYLSRSTDMGKTWTSSQLAPFDQKNTTFPDPPRLAWTPGGGAQGTLHLVRQRAPRPELASVRDVIYQRSTDGGKSWSEPRTLNDDDPAGLRYHGIPNITAAPNGRIDVAWWDTRHDEGARVNDVYYASSADDGLSWTKNIRITDRSVDRSIGVWGFNFDMSTSPGRSTHRDIGDRPGAGDSGLSGPRPVRSRSYSTTQADLQES